MKGQIAGRGENMKNNCPRKEACGCAPKLWRPRYPAGMSRHNFRIIAGKNLMAKAGKTGDTKRELIDTGKDKRYVRRDEKGQFSESDDQSRSLSQDVKKTAKTASKPGQGDKGDKKTGK